MWPILTVRDAIQDTSPLARAEFTTIRSRLVKLGDRTQETASRIKIAFAAACPQASLFRYLTNALMLSCTVKSEPKSAKIELPPATPSPHRQANHADEPRRTQGRAVRSLSFISHATDE